MAKISAIILDIEAAKGILKEGEQPEMNWETGAPYEYANGFDDHTNPPAIVCAWDCSGDGMPQRLYLREDLNELRDLITRSQHVVTFNGQGFDLPKLANCGVEVPTYKSIDLAELMLQATGKRSKLETVAKKNITGGVLAKPMSGAEAPKIWQRFQANPTKYLAEFRRLVEYCHHDVWLTWRLYMTARKQGGLRNSYGDFIKMELA